MHKGKLATKVEAVEYGQSALEYIRRVREELASLLGERLHLMNARRMMRICRLDFEKALNDPITAETPESLQYEGIGAIRPNRILGDDSFQAIQNCLGRPSPTHGLMK